jgi:hypothetical protein
MEFVAFLFYTALVSWVSWGTCYFYFKPKFEAAEEIIEELMKENAALKVSIAAGMATPEAKKICELTFAALNVKIDAPAKSSPSPTYS